MQLLIITQKIDETDANLGFFVGWLKQFSKHATVTVVANEIHPGASACLSGHAVTLFSLGKERGANRFARFFRYQRLLFQMLPASDGVFFHMCPEYALAAHILPRVFRVKTILWYVHGTIGWRLRLAALLVNLLCTASRESCRLRSRKVDIVGHGVAPEFFASRLPAPRGLRLITVGRISPVKNMRTLVLGFLELQKRFPDTTLSIVGEPITEVDRLYREEVRGLSPHARFQGGISHTELPRVLGEATAFIHASRTGSMDKAALEALAAGLPVFTSSEAFSEDIPGVVKFREDDPKDLAEKITETHRRGEISYNEAASALVRRNHSLERLIERIVAFYTGFPPTPAPAEHTGGLE